MLKILYPIGSLHALAVLAALRHVPTASAGAVPALLAPTRPLQAPRVGARRATATIAVMVPATGAFPLPTAALAARAIPGLLVLKLHVLVLTDVLRSPGGGLRMAPVLVALIHFPPLRVYRVFFPRRSRSLPALSVRVAEPHFAKPPVVHFRPL